MEHYVPWYVVEGSNGMPGMAENMSGTGRDGDRSAEARKAPASGIVNDTLDDKAAPFPRTVLVLNTHFFLRRMQF